MTANLVSYRTLIKNWLVASTDIATWTDALVDEGLRHALVEFAAAAPPVESTITVTTGGRTQDVGSIPDLSEVASIAWPWSDDDQALVPCRWRRKGPTGVIIESGVPAVGDRLCVRYWRRQTVTNLDGATVTTVPEVREHLLVVGAAAHALLLRVRQVAEHPAVPPGAAAVLQSVATAWLEHYRDGLAHMALAPGTITWGNVGL